MMKIPITLPEMDKNTLEWLSLAASAAIDPETATKAKLRRARKWIVKSFLPMEEIPAHIRPYLAPEVSDEQFFAFLCACDDQVQALKEQHMQEMEQLTDDLPPDCAQLLLQIVRRELNIQLCRREGNALHLYAGLNRGSLIRHLTLQDAHGFPVLIAADDIEAEGTLFRDEDGRFGLPLQITPCPPPSAEDDTDQDEDVSDDGTMDDEFCSDDEPLSCVVTFSGATMEYIICRVEPLNCLQTPWAYLISAADAILEKNELLPHTLNDKERALLPLLTELSGFFSNETAAPLLTAMAEEEGCTKLYRLLNKCRGSVQGFERLQLELSHARSEPLWRRIAGLLAESQIGYPVKNEGFSAPSGMDAIRAQITDILHANGYTGTYPDFEKRGPLSRTCVAASGHPFVKMRDHLLLRGRPGIYRIHCREHFYTHIPGILLECVSQFPKRGEPELDRIACMFDHGDHCFKDYVMLQIIPDSDTSNTLPQSLLRAMLNAEHRRPNREQRQALDLPAQGDTLRAALAMGLAFGVLFGILCTPALALLLTGFAVIDGVGAFLPLLADFPWLETLVFSTVGFGGFLAVYLWFWLE